MRKLLLILSLTLPLLAFNQNITVIGNIIDYKKESIKSVKIIYGKQPEDYTTSKFDGSFIFKTYLTELDNITFKHIAFEGKSIAVSKRLKKKIKNDTLILNVKLNDFELGIIEVGIKTPAVVFESKIFSVSDFQALPNGNMVLLSYEKTLKKGSKIKLIDSLMTELDSYIVLDECIELTTDFRNNIHLITKTNVYQISIKSNRLYLYKEDKNYYYKYLAPIIDTLADRIYYSNYSPIYPAFDYMEFNKTDSIYNTLLGVQDKPLMEQYRAEFRFSDVRTKLWAHQKQIETGIDKEIWVGATVFTHSLYYTPLYAPLFVQHDSVLVFDHYENKLYKHTPQSGLVDSTNITYHFNSRKSGWEHPLIQDKNTEAIYAVFMRNGFTFLSLLNTNTGDIIKTFKLYYKYIEGIQIIDNIVYYIYRPYESIQKKYIYKETLNRLELSK